MYVCVCVSVCVRVCVSAMYIKPQVSTLFLGAKVCPRNGWEILFRNEKEIYNIVALHFYLVAVKLFYGVSVRVLVCECAPVAWLIQ